MLEGFPLLLVYLVALGISLLFLVGAAKTLFGVVQQKYPHLFARTKNADIPELGRAQDNPVITSKHQWEAEATLNPAALHEDGRVHLLYRAIGGDGVSRIGYASSADGVHFDDRHPEPVFAVQDPRRLRIRPQGPQMYSLAHYPSGGSWGGIEDPRMVAINDRIYMTFNMFDGWDFIRVGLTSIAKEDFFAKRWRWNPVAYLSPAGQIHKNWMLFPEKVNGKFAMLHNLHGEDANHVRIEYRDEFESGTTSYERFESPDPQRVPDRPLAWHKRMRSAGPPPIRTKYGWLLLYHAMAHNEPHKYKMGAMLLDENDPTRVIARAPVPVLEPNASYEMNGAKPGIVYGCGAVVKDEHLMVYYGAADNHVCAAAAPLTEFARSLANHRAPSLLVLT